MSGEERLVTEIPSSLKQLARIVARGFYTIEDALIIDMLVRNPCMKEDDLLELLKFEKKQMRARIATLRNDKFIQIRLKMETGSDGKAQKVNYYFINYKSFVNVVKYKLLMMRKKLETEERNATSRASFKCTNCLKTYTDLEADQLFDMSTQEFKCTYCGEIVEEDQSALPKKDSRLLLARFNEQMEPLYILLRDIEGIKLAPELLEPEAVDINTIKGIDPRKSGTIRGPNDQWSGEGSRTSGFFVEETKVNVLIGDGAADDNSVSTRKEQPIWMTDSTIDNPIDDSLQTDSTITQDNILNKAAATASTPTTINNKQGEDIMSVLLAHEKKGGMSDNNAVKSVIPQESSDSSDNEDNNDMQPIETDAVEMMDSEEEDSVPMITVGGKNVAITNVNDSLIAEMTPVEKEAYIQAYQEYYSLMYD
ncbi:general transcription factor IIE subunit 1 [Leptopilina boulardi]|uniref:general transcription factor IIE subunit 1 n=1 Tax=Leptopilina boulardi TaxID=63433 RepID=UPI0021F5A855|nr:general transcription factor IIE subunit 1 [Leptopilina boulardi]XP_051174351.1 general transcription factor IIE subunit 1 [Leptopilina boulardi]